MTACLLALLIPRAQIVHIPDESPGIDGIARTLTSAFDQVDIVALGENHEGKADSALRIALVRDQDFAKKVHAIVVEFASTKEQPTLDRYIRGEYVPEAQLEKVWTKTSQGEDAWTSPTYPAFFAAVRDVNKRLPANAQIHVFGGDPGAGDDQNRDAPAENVVKDVLQNHGKVLILYGAGHFFRTEGDVADIFNDNGAGTMMMKLETDYPGRTFVVLPVGGPVTHAMNRPDTADYTKFDHAIKSQARPVLILLQRPPFQDFTAEEFIGRKLLTGLRGPGLVSIFKGSKLTLAQLGDACVYFGHSD